MKFNILVVTETKRKGSGECIVGNQHTLIYSGMSMTDRASGGVRLIMHRDTAKNLIK